MTDPRVVKLAAHHMRLDDGHDVEPGVGQVDEARSHAHWTITDLEAAGLTVIDTTDEATVRAVSHVLWPDAAYDIPAAYDYGVRLLLAYLSGGS